MRESSLWTWLKKGVKDQMASGDLDMNRVENLADDGSPDVEGCDRGVQFWLELKCSERPVRPATPVRVRFEPGQIPWAKRRARAGGRTWVLLQVGSGAKADVFLLRPDQLDDLAAGSFNLDRLFRECPSPWTARETIGIATGRIRLPADLAQRG